MAEPEAVTQFRDKILSEGPLYFNTFSKLFYAADADDDWLIQRAELKGLLESKGITVADGDLDAIVAHFDTEGNGTINRNEFMAGMRSPITKLRKALVLAAFHLADKNRDGAITVEDLHGAYDVSTDPRLVSGEKSEDELFAELIAQFDKPNTPDGKVTEKEFLTYYMVVSKNTKSDDDFADLVTNTWKL